MKEFEEIHQHVFIGTQKLYTEIMSLKDKATREALIKMGWTPPNEEGVCSEESYTTKEG
jgi:hypothetical protein